MHWVKKLYQSGYSHHITIPMCWVKSIKSKLGFTPTEVTITEAGDDLLVKAVKPDNGVGNES